MNKIFSTLLRKNQTPIICKENQIICSDPKIIEAIDIWLQKVNRTWDDFKDFLSYMEVPAPVVLSEFKSADDSDDSSDDSFKCLSLKNEEFVKMSFKNLSLNVLTTYHTIETIKDYEGVSTMAIYAVSVAGERKIWLQKRIFNYSEKTKADKFVYDKEFFSCEIHFDSLTLKINVDLPSRDNITVENSSILRADPGEIQLYLLFLYKNEEPIIIEEVYKKVLSLLHIAECNISRSCYIEFELSEEVETENGQKEQRILEKIVKNWGVTSELAVNYYASDEIYHVKKDGGWSYFSNETGKSIVYDFKEKNTSIIGFGDVLSGKLFGEDKALFNKVMAEIETLKAKLK